MCTAGAGGGAGSVGVMQVRQEVKFLEKFLAPGKLEGLKREHIGCSNLAHQVPPPRALLVFHCVTLAQASLVGLLVEEAAPLAVLQPFTFAGEGGERRVVVDIVSDQGNTWVKVVARNARALALNSQGGAQFGQRCILDQVRPRPGPGPGPGPGSGPGPGPCPDPGPGPGPGQ